MWDSAALISKCDVFMKSLLPKLRDMRGKMRPKDCRLRMFGDAKTIVSSRYNRKHAHMNSKKWWQHAHDMHKFNKEKCHKKEGMWTQSPTHDEETMYGYSCYKKVNGTFPIQWYLVYQLYSKVGPMLKKNLSIYLSTYLSIYLSIIYLVHCGFFIMMSWHLKWKIIILGSIILSLQGKCSFLAFCVFWCS